MISAYLSIPSHRPVRIPAYRAQTWMAPMLGQSLATHGRHMVSCVVRVFEMHCRGVPLLSSSGEVQDGNPALICRFEFI